MRFDVLRAVKMSNIVPCRRRQYVTPKLWYPPTGLHRVSTHTTNVTQNYNADNILHSLGLASLYLSAEQYRGNTTATCLAVLALCSRSVMTAACFSTKG
jgi:hypothetical protein